MGYDASAHLMYGFPVPEDKENYRSYLWHEAPKELQRDEDYWEWEDEYALRKGIQIPTVPYEGNEDLYKAYWDAKRDAVKESGIDIERLNWCEEPDLFLTVLDGEGNRHAYYGDVQPQPLLKVKADWLDVIRDFCEVMEIPYEEPDWYLAPSLSM